MVEQTVYVGNTKILPELAHMWGGALLEVHPEQWDSGSHCVL